MAVRIPREPEAHGDRKAEAGNKWAKEARGDEGSSSNSKALRWWRRRLRREFPLSLRLTGTRNAKRRTMEARNGGGWLQQLESAAGGGENSYRARQGRKGLGWDWEGAWFRLCITIRTTECNSKNRTQREGDR